MQHISTRISALFASRIAALPLALTMALVLALILEAATAPARAETYPLASLEAPPYVMRQGGRVTGISAEVARAAFQRLGHEAVLETASVDEIWAGLKDGRFQGVFDLYRTPEREALLDFGQESLADQVVVLMVRKDSPIPDAPLGELLETQADRAWGLVQGASNGPGLDKALVQGRLHRVVPAANSLENMKNLLAGRVDILASSRYGAMRLLEGLGRTDDVRELAPPLETLPSFLALAKTPGSPALVQALDQALTDMKRDGTIQSILEAWFKASLEQPAKRPGKKSTP